MNAYCPKSPENPPAHHRILESPNGRVLIAGVCKYCGDTKEYIAYFEDFPADVIRRNMQRMAREMAQIKRTRKRDLDQWVA